MAHRLMSVPVGVWLVQQPTMHVLVARHAHGRVRGRSPHEVLVVVSFCAVKPNPMQQEYRANDTSAEDGGEQHRQVVPPHRRFRFVQTDGVPSEVDGRQTQAWGGARGRSRRAAALTAAPPPQKAPPNPERAHAGSEVCVARSHRAEERMADESAPRGSRSTLAPVKPCGHVRDLSGLGGHDGRRQLHPWGAWFVLLVVA